MAFAVWQKSVRDMLGLSAPDARVYVTREGSGLPATLYGDREGTVTLPNPLPVGADGYFRFYALGGRHRILAFRGPLEAPTQVTEWRDVPIGTAQEIDTDFLAEPGYQYNYVELLTTPPLTAEIRFNNLDLSLATEAYVHSISISGQDTTERMLDLDSAGKSLPNTLNIVASQVGFSYLILNAVDSGDYVTLTLENHTGAADINPQRVTLQREISGADGTDPGLLYTFAEETVEADPGFGRVRFNNANLSLATKAFVSIENRASDNLTPRLMSVNDWGSPGFRATLNIVRSGAPGEATFDIALATDESPDGYVTFDVQHQGGVTDFIDDDLISLQLIPVGQPGAGLLRGTEEVKTATYAVVLGDRGQHLVANAAGAITFNFDPAATLGNEFMVLVSVAGAGNLILEPAGIESINGVANLTLRSGQSGLVSSNGTNLRLILRERAKTFHLDDVDSTGWIEGDILGYDSATKTWKRERAKLGALVDVNLTTPPNTGEGLVWNGTEYVPGPAGGGMFRGNNGTVGNRSGDIFRVNAQTVTVNVTIGATENASATGPIEVATGIVLEVSTGGTLVIL